ncbi:hypothetical protein [Kallotenue papyrolyticum]|uniref:hypothetical protein n=1 Tax=Kallotenue papyrolyticum TaxID=1325125 RepID=UPI0004785EE7|nr:hypothetical protein [Kallotenue papyrolyticum]
MKRRTRIPAVILVGAAAVVGLTACGGQPLPINQQAPGIATATPGAPLGAAPGLFESPAAQAGGQPAEGAASPEAPPVEQPGAPAVESPPPMAEPTPEPTVNPQFSSVTLPSVEERWRYVQVDRQPFEQIQTWTTPSRQILWWYDPVHGRAVKLGEIQGDFPVQATFRFRGQEVEALEVPYQVNQSFGITVPPALLEQIRNAGYGEWIEAFVYRTEDIRPK